MTYYTAKIALQLYCTAVVVCFAENGLLYTVLLSAAVSSSLRDGPHGVSCRRKIFQAVSHIGAVLNRKYADVSNLQCTLHACSLLCSTALDLC